MQNDIENCVYSCRGYQPGALVFYNIDSMPENCSDTPPVWPGAVQVGGGIKTIWNREKIDQYFNLWASLSNTYKKGVICGEWGCCNNTPHKTMLAWAEDMLSSMKERNIGFALWYLHGPFGIINSERSDVEYEVLENGAPCPLNSKPTSSRNSAD